MQLLKTLRKQINRLDKGIINLLNKRAEIILKVGHIKVRSGKGVYSPDREADVLKRCALLNRGPLTKGAVQAIYKEIMSASLSLEKAISIAYLGPEATFTHLAALKKFGSQVSYYPCNTISEIFLEVERGVADYGVVPIENSIEGAVTHTLDMLVDSDLRVCAQIILDVSHNLLSRYNLKTIKYVYSNPQVFGQCRLWLQKNLPQAELVEVSSTTRAAQLAGKNRCSAAIASMLAAKVYKLKVVAQDIEDSPHNITRFLVIGRHEVSPTGCDRTSVVFSVKDKVGALYDMLAPFKKYRINLTKIESRPSKKRAWDYYFFIDLNGHCRDAKVRKALNELEGKCKFLKVLGSYPITE